MVAVRGAGLPVGLLHLERVDHRLPRQRLLARQLGVDRGQSRLVTEQPADRDAVLPGLSELGPVRDDRRVQVELAALREQVRTRGRRALGRREHDLQRVAVVRHAVVRALPTPEVDDPACRRRRTRTSHRPRRAPRSCSRTRRALPRTPARRVPRPQLPCTDATTQSAPEANVSHSVRVAGVVPGREPALALLRRPVGPRLAVDGSGGRPLDPVVADRGRRVEPVGDVGRGDLGDQRGVDGVRRPHAGVAVGLQLQPHRSRLRSLAVVTHPFVRAQQVLHVVAVLVREDVRLREPAALRTEPGPQLVVEAEIEVHLPVAGAVERPDRGVGHAAPGRHLAVEEHGLRRRVALYRARPVLLHRVHDRGDQAVGALVGVRTGLAIGRQLAGAVEHVRARPSAAVAQPVREQEDEHEDHPGDPATAVRDPAADADARPAHRPCRAGPTPGSCRAPPGSGTSLRSAYPIRGRFILSAGPAGGRAPARRARCAGSRWNRRRSCRSG